MSTPNKNLQQTKKIAKISQTKKRQFLKVPSNVNFHTGRALKPLIVILGPTASGKSEMALRLARKLNGEIVSADSRQIYKKMNVGTAKPYISGKWKVESGKWKSKTLPHILPLPYSGGGDKEEMGKFKPIIINKIPHYLIDIIKPNQNFSVAEYKELAVKIIRDIHSRGKIPILAGGTGLYISSIVDNIEIPRVMPNLKLRKKLEKIPPTALLKQLKKLDPVAFDTIDKKNKRRIIRALEVTISTGKPFSAQRAKGAPLFNTLQIGLDIPREKLYKKIDSRVEKMFKLGLIKETKKLVKRYSEKLPSMSGIGYKETGMYLRGEITLEKAKELMKFATHNYARRQMTWFRKDERIKWVKNFNQTQKLIKKFLADF